MTSRFFSYRAAALAFGISLGAGCVLLIDVDGEQCQSTSDCRLLDPTSTLLCREGLCVARDPSTDALPLVVDDHFAATGREGDAAMGALEATAACPVRGGLQRGDCHAFAYDASALAEPMGWAGVSWQHPDHNAGAEPGFPMPMGARAISFFAWSDTPGTMALFGAGFQSADGFQARTEPVVLGTTPEQFWLPIEALYDEVATGFLWQMSAPPGDEGVVLYLDDIVWTDSGPPVPVTFEVDVSAEGLDAECTVYVYGSFNDWTPRATPMAETDASGVYAATVVLPTNQATEYKFLHVCSDLEAPEELPSGLACTTTEVDIRNRIVTPTETATLPLVCFGTCSACMDIVDVTLQVDLGIKPLPPGCSVRAPGSYNGWQYDDAHVEMSNGGEGSVYSVTLSLMSGIQHQYKHMIACPVMSNDDWETLTPDTCTILDGANVNRVLLPEASEPSAPVCWEQCASCP